MTLTARQQAVLDYIAGFTANSPFGPSLREIVANTSLPATSSVADTLAELRGQGLVESDATKARTLRLTTEGRQHTRSAKACPVCLGSGVDPNEQPAVVA